METLHRRRRRKSSRQRGMSKALHDVEGTEVPMFSRAGRGRKSSCSLGQSEVLVVSGHRKTSRSGAHRYVNLSRLAGIVDLAVGGRIPSSCKPPSRRISVSTFAQGSRTHRNLYNCSRIHHGGIWTYVGGFGFGDLRECGSRECFVSDLLEGVERPSSSQLEGVCWKCWWLCASCCELGILGHCRALRIQPVKSCIRYYQVKL